MRKTGRGSKTVEPFRRLEDIESVRAVLRKVSHRDLALFEFNIHVGLRASDLLALDWEQLVSPTDVRQEFKLQERKTQRVATYAIPKPARDALRTWWKLSPGVGLVFPSLKGGKRLLVTSLHHLVNKWAKEAGVAGHFGTHSLRKTFGYHAYRNGHLTLEQLMHHFGHSSSRITLRYIGVTDEDVAQAARKLDLTKPAPTPKRGVLKRGPRAAAPPDVQALAEKLARLPASSRQALAQLLQALGEE